MIYLNGAKYKSYKTVNYFYLYISLLYASIYVSLAIIVYRI